MAELCVGRYSQDAGGVEQFRGGTEPAVQEVRLGLSSHQQQQAGADAGGVQDRGVAVHVRRPGGRGRLRG